MYRLLRQITTSQRLHAMPRGHGARKDKVQALARNKKSVKSRDYRLASPKLSRSLARRGSQDNKNTEKANADENQKSCKGTKAKQFSSTPTLHMETWRSKSEGLVKKLSKLRIGASHRISPTLQQIPSTKSRYLSTYTVTNLSQIAELIQSGKCKNVIVMVGAGISTASGIPDFRTPGSGLYDNLQEYDLPHPTAVFDIYYFSRNPKPFFRLAKELYPGRFQPNYVHYFLRVLHEKGLLLRLYTQNIDALERIAGIPEDKLVEAHGSFATATCRNCGAKYKEADIKKQVMENEIPLCHKSGCKGVVKPDIVFFGEDLPPRFFKYRTDFQSCDLLMVFGTSLEVEPFASLVYEAKRSTPRLLISREVVGTFRKSKRRANDVVAKGDITEQTKSLASLLGWTEEIEKLLPVTS